MKFRDEAIIAALVAHLACPGRKAHKHLEADGSDEYEVSAVDHPNYISGVVPLVVNGDLIMFSPSHRSELLHNIRVVLPREHREEYCRHP
jgi:hypothetical protein